MITARWARLAERGELGLLPYLVAGYPTLDASLEHVRRVVAAGADFVELGIPYGDPVADGPAIQRAGRAALDSGTRLRHVLDALEGFDAGAPLFLMSYLNPLLALGRGRAVEALARRGVAGLIVPDLPLEEAQDWSAATAAAGLALVLLAAPTSDDARLRRIAERTQGFLYYVSVTGTTGARAGLPADLPAALDRLRSLSELPVAVGFGISTPEQVGALRGRCAGVVVGSRLVEALRRGEDLGDLIGELKAATRRT